jgi:NAD(P) transhydrogenase subunit alpha
MSLRISWWAGAAGLGLFPALLAAQADSAQTVHAPPATDLWPLVYVFVLSTFIGLGIIRRVSRLLHTPLMSITNAISAIAVVGSIIVTGSDYPTPIRVMGAVALFASMTNIVSGFLITDRMLKMFKTDEKPAAGGRP